MGQFMFCIKFFKLHDATKLFIGGSQFPMFVAEVALELSAAVSPCGECGFEFGVISSLMQARHHPLAPAWQQALL